LPTFTLERTRGTFRTLAISGSALFHFNFDSVPRREQAPIATSTQHQQMITDALEKVITAINQADVSEQEKNEAKTLLQLLLGSKAAVSVLGPGAQSLAAKYFTE